MDTRPSTGTTGTSWNEVWLVLVAGAVGGFLSWVYSTTLGQPTALPWWGAIPASIVLGTGAAFIGVFVIANSDLRALPRCLGFALLCGISWKPVIEAGGALVDQSVRQRTDRTAIALAERTRELASQLPGTATDQLPTKIRQTADSAVRLAEVLPRVENAQVRARVQQDLEEAVAAMKAVAPQQPLATVSALEQVGVSAVEAKAPNLARIVADSVADIAKTLKQPEVGRAAGNSLRTIAQAAETKGDTRLAIESRHKAGEVLLQAIKANPQSSAIRPADINDVQRILIHAQKYYEAVNEPSLAAKVEVELRELESHRPTPGKPGASPP